MLLIYSAEVVSKRGQLSSNEYYDEESSVKWMVYSSNQVRRLDTRSDQR